MRTGSPEATSESWPQLQEAVRLFMGMCTRFLPLPNVPVQRRRTDLRAGTLSIAVRCNRSLGDWHDI